MFYSIQIPSNMPADVARFKARQIARQNILIYTLRSDEIEINKYLLENYKSDLKSTCLKLMNNAKYIASMDELIIKFNTVEDDKLARLITYGDGKIRGSRILRDIFRED